MKFAKLAFIGAGNMAEAIFRAVTQRQIIAPDMIVVCDPEASRRAVFASLGARCETDNAAALNAETIIIAVKPQQAADLWPGLKSLNAQTLVISIMAGISLANIEAHAAARVIRVMPNLPIVRGQGMSVIARGKLATAGDENFALEIFGAGGEAIALDERHFDAVTAVSGSGPAYVFLLTELLTRGAAQLGLPEKIAEKLARQTVVGAAEILKNSADAAAAWRERVTSKGGTTAAALVHFERCNFAQIIAEALDCAAKRSAELGK